jgi:hypothetical protein
MIFDTSGINKLEDGGFTSEPLMKALECGYEVILTAMSADEIISTKSPVRRDAVLTVAAGVETAGIAGIEAAPVVVPVAVDVNATVTVATEILCWMAYRLSVCVRVHQFQQASELYSWLVGQRSGRYFQEFNSALVRRSL